jgi:hypothetical protein
MGEQGMRWIRAEFDTMASHGPIHRKGYVCDSFAIAKDRQDQDWGIYHLPTGMSFIYSYWPTLSAAKLFAGELMKRGKWNNKNMDRNPSAFHLACDEAADSLGVERRKMVRI